MKINPWPCGIILFFLLFFAGMTAAVVIASTHRDSVVSENYYEQELKFQARLDSAARAQQCGARLQFDAPARRLQFSVPAAQLARNFSGIIELYRPSASSLDCKFPLVPQTDGTASLDLSALASGPWQIHVTWTAANQSYFLEQKITL